MAFWCEYSKNCEWHLWTSCISASVCRHEKSKVSFSIP